MRPLLKASTALLASLSLLVPSVSSAQTLIIEEPVKTENPASDLVNDADAASDLQAESVAEPEQQAPETAETAPDTEAEPIQPEVAPEAESVPATEPAPEPDVAAETEATPEQDTAPEAEAAPEQEAAPDTDQTEGSDVSTASDAPETAAPADDLPPPADEQEPADEAAAPAPEATDTPSAEVAEPEAGPADIDTTDENDEVLKRALEKAEQDGTATEPAAQAIEPEAETSPETTVDLTDAPAPEADAIETDLSREAANPVEPEETAALKALLDKAADPEAVADPVEDVQDFTVTEDSVRSSDEDFQTSTAGSSEEPASEAKNHKSRDLARLALAGMAGLAVGKMLSDNRKVALNTGDRMVVTLPDGSQQLIKDEDTLLFQPGSNVQTERYADGSSITTVKRADGSQVVTIRDAKMNILRRSVLWPDGRSTMLIDDTAVEPVEISKLPPPARPVDYSSRLDEQSLREALMQEADIGRHFTLGQIRNIAQVRALIAPLDIQSITFDTGSAAITPDQAAQLSTLGRVIAEAVRQNPNEIFLIEGYTDAIGSEASNLALSDRRAESVALALTEYFKVPPENMVVQGYGEQFLRIQTQEAERANRRVAVRRITELLARN